MLKIYEADNHMLIYTEHLKPARHRHMAAHIIISIKDKIEVLAENKSYFGYGIMIPSGTVHFVNTNEQPVLVFLYDGTTSVAKQIKNVKVLSKTECNRVIDLYAEFEKDYRANRYKIFEKQFLQQLGITESACSVTDDRIISAMKYVYSTSSEKISCQEVADAVFLSPGRFSHLFKEQAGMTFAAYLVYQRIMYAYKEILGGKTITEAALEAGFSSAAHFADTNRRVFGLSVSSIIQNLQFTKVS